MMMILFFSTLGRLKNSNGCLLPKTRGFPPVLLVLQPPRNLQSSVRTGLIVLPPLLYFPSSSISSQISRWPLLKNINQTHIHAVVYPKVFLGLCTCSNSKFPPSPAFHTFTDDQTSASSNSFPQILQHSKPFYSTLNFLHILVVSGCITQLLEEQNLRVKL